MKKIIINSDNRRFNISSIVVGYLEENKEEILEFEIPEKYSEYGKKACFSANGQTFAKTFDDVISNKLTITRDISQFKELDMTIAFFKIENEDEIVARTSILHILIENAIVCDDDVKPDDHKVIVLDNLIDEVTKLDVLVTKNEEIRENQETARQENEETRQNNENSRQEYIENLKDKVNKGDFNGATYLPSVDKEGNISWTNDKGLENPSSQNIRGPQGIQGPQGEAFKIKKTYPSIEAMQADFNNMEVGDYVMITSNIEVEDNAKLYSKTETEWVFITDFSGATGIQGEQGPQGEQGIQGERGIGISRLEVRDGSLYVTLTDNTTQNAGLIITDEAKNYIIDQVTNNAKSDFNVYYDDKVANFDNLTANKIKEYNDNASQKIAEYDEHSTELNNKIIATRNELERVKNDILETGTDSDTYIHLEDSAMAEYQELEVDGVCKQETTSVSAGDEYDSPSPDFPQPISTIENSLKITSCNKNLLPNNATSQTIGGVTFTVNEDGSITANGTATQNINYILYNHLKLELGTFTLSGCPSGGSTTTYYLSLALQGIYTFYIDTGNGHTQTYKKFNYDNTNTTYRIFIGNGTVCNNLTFKPQFEKGKKATSYEQHLETQITANLPEGEFIGKINDTYKDTLKVEYNADDGQYHLNLYKSIAKVVLNGSENVEDEQRDGTDNTKLYRVDVRDIKLYSRVISNYFKYAYNWDVNKNTIYVGGSRIIYIRVSKDEFSTKEEFKQWLSTHNTEVYYVLATPYVVDLGIVDMPITYNEITNLFTDSDLLPQINAKYYRNFISTIQNLQVNEKALKQELVDINARLSALETAQTNVASESEVIE